MIKVDRERVVYAVIGMTWICWGPIYWFYRKQAAWGREVCEKRGIRVEIVRENEAEGVRN